jgi:predicted Zn-dependent protease
VVPLIAAVFCASPSPRPVTRAEARPPAAAAPAPVPDAASEKLGREMAARLFARDPLTPDGRLLRYVNLVGRTAVGAMPTSRRFRFAVTQSDVPYSIALPGQFIALSRGMLFLMSSEADLAVALSREVLRSQQPGGLRETPGESADPAFELWLDAGGARLAFQAGYDVSGFLHVLESLRDRAVSARDLSDLRTRLEAYKAIPEFSRGGKTLADRFRSSAIL